MSWLPSASRTMPPAPRRRRPAGRCSLPPTTAALLRAWSAWEAGPGMEVARIRFCSIMGPIISVPEAARHYGIRGSSHLDAAERLPGRQA